MIYFIFISIIRNRGKSEKRDKSNLYKIYKKLFVVHFKLKS